MRRRCDSDKCALSTDKLQSILPSMLFLSFIATAQRGNDIFPFYHRRAAFLQMHLLRL